MTMKKWHNISGLRGSAKAALPLPVFDYIDGGAEDELSLHDATRAFDRYDIIPRMLMDVSQVSSQTEIFGRRIEFPVMLAPTGLTRLFHKEAELGVARAATAAGLPYCLSTLGTTTIEDFADAVPGSKLFQIYIFKDRGLTEEFVERARACKYDGLVLTADTLVGGKRERDLANGLSLPPRLTMRGFLGFAAKPRWSLPALFGSKFDFVNVAHRVAAMSAGPTTLQDYVAGQFDRTVTWKDVEWLAGKWGGPLAVKGILHPGDAVTALESGADTVMVSNHGGRQIDTAAAPIDQIAPIADAVGGRMKIICDGGIRRGSHILKALALGADAVSIGRPYLYGLAAAGSTGVSRAIDILRDEFDRCMVLSGATCPDDLNRELVRPHIGA
ncbi:alpha-hydroxy acid oxidase [Novosphingobium album (ex Hu et al. 2023)]|uniref:Alpha-hydroxy-acid oxidizing protein n=1 Tax=Novosphingobium album (ex Hu et al. 2023) TaxID=2930093 RepID=A0ABT0B6U0_9SPHN|nr:alpha-hydroxy acid oxidase [Novosphingobium album (ex Hu et al. 2023)]MCJ2180737.1 alpha-hydroxy-acid oxidizing protein [Novosphingobium album (ex Hu et al. 2023)]